MFSNYFKVAIRNLLRQKGFSFINIFGLALGISCTALIGMWVNDDSEANAIIDGFERAGLPIPDGLELPAPKQVWRTHDIKGLGRSYAWKDLIAADARQIKLFGESRVEEPCGCYDGEPA